MRSLASIASSCRSLSAKLRAIRFLVPQMQHGGGETAVLAADAITDHADENVGILAAPAGVAGIEAVDRDEIVAPECHVAAARAAPPPCRRLRKPFERQRQQRQEPVDVAAQAAQEPVAESSRVPAGRPTFRTRSVIFSDSNTRLPVTNQPGSISRRCAATKVGPRDAIAVEKNAIVAVADADRAVADFGQPEAVVRVPRVFQRRTSSGATTC